MTHQLDPNKSNDSTHAPDVSKDARVFDVEKLAREAGITQVPGVDDTYIVSLDQLESLAALVLEQAAKRLKADTESAQDFEGAISAIRALAEGVR